MIVIEKEPKAGADLRVGDILRDDIYVRIISVCEPNYDETAIMVEDGNGYTYMIRIGMDATYDVYPWEDWQWEHYRNGL